MTTIEPFRDKQTIKNIILDMAQRKRQTVHGQKAINRQLPKHLGRKTEDFDIYTKQPEKSANELATKLNKIFKSKKFKVSKGIHKGTYKVKKNGKVVADYTSTTKKPRVKRILGIAYADLASQTRKLKKIVRKPELKFRHEKDKGTLAKLKQHEMSSFLMR